LSRLEEIKGDTHPHNSIIPLPKGKELVIYEKDFNYLIEQAETFQQIKESWIDIENNGNQSDASDFYTVVRDILHDYEMEGDSDA